MKEFCPNCGKETEQRLIRETREIDIRGEIIPVDWEYYQCEECGQEYEARRPDFDPLDRAYREFRRRTGMLQPEEIKEFRKKLDLTQREFSQILGIGLATLNRYENGALQSEAHDQHIRLSMQPNNLQRLIEGRPGVLSDKNRERLFHVLEDQRDDCGNLLTAAVEQFGAYPPGILSGYQPFDIDKFIQAVKYFCLKEGVVKTKLVKLLFYADFKHYKDQGISITGARYAHATHGPVPDRFDTWLTALTEWRDELAVEEKVYGEHTGEEYTSREVDLSVFRPSEIATLSQVKTAFALYSAKRIRETSHQEKGYQATKDGELISYKFAEELSI